MRGADKTLINSAYRLAKTSKAKAIFLSLDPLSELPDEDPPKGCRLIYLTRQSAQELAQAFPNGATGTSLGPHIVLPKIDLTRLGQVKMGVLLALSNQLIKVGDKVIFVTGVPGKDSLDSLVCVDTGTESELITAEGLGKITASIKPEVFQAALGLALELGSVGREGRPVGTIFVIGDEEKVLQLSKQMIINPFRGYTDQERSILDPKLKETIREFAAIDGAFVISGEGLVLSAGVYLGAASAEEGVPRGLGARHIAAAGITAMTGAVALVISESSGDVRIFENGKIVMEIEKPVRT